MKSITYTRENKVYPKDDNGHTSCKRFYIESIDEFTVSICEDNNNMITVEKNGRKKTVFVKECRSKYVYRLLKTRVEARGEAAGLFKFITDALPFGLFSCSTWHILDHIADEMRPAQIAAGM